MSETNFQKSQNISGTLAESNFESFTSNKTNSAKDNKASKIKDKPKVKVNQIKYINIFIFIFFIVLNFSKCHNLLLKSQISSNVNEVTLKLSEAGNDMQILGTNFLCPSRILIDGTIRDFSDCHYIYLTSSESVITLQWDVNINTTRYMFNGCKKITELNMTKFDISLVTDMYSMFYHCEELKILDISNFNTKNVTNMQGVFALCYKLESLNVQSFDTSKVKLMKHMFQNCYILTSLNLSHFKTGLVTNMGYMFNGCKYL